MAKGTVTFTVDADLYEQLQPIAGSKGKTVEDMIAQFIERFVEYEQGDAPTGYAGKSLEDRIGFIAKEMVLGSSR